MDAGEGGAGSAGGRSTPPLPSVQACGDPLELFRVDESATLPLASVRRTVVVADAHPLAAPFQSYAAGLVAQARGEV